MIRLVSIIGCIVGISACCLALYVHPISRSGSYQHNSEPLSAGHHLSWFWQHAVPQSGATYRTLNADPSFQDNRIGGQILLRVPSPSRTNIGDVYTFKTVIDGPTVVTAANTALLTLKASVDEAEKIALEQERLVSKKARAHINNQLSLQAQQEISYAAKLREFQQQLLMIEQDTELAASVRAAETRAVSTRTKADIENGRQRLQAMRDRLMADALSKEGATQLLRMDVIRQLGQGKQRIGAASATQTINDVRRLFRALESEPKREIKKQAKPTRNQKKR